MNSSERSEDIVDFIERMAAESGHFEPVDENYYRAFLHLTQQEIEKLAVAVMLAQEKEVRRLAGGRSTPQSVAEVARFIRAMFTAISFGVARFDAFGRLGFVARIGDDPTEEMWDAMDDRFQLIEPMITNTIRVALPWLLSRVWAAK